MREFKVVCPEGVVADDCIPKCNADIQGDLLLLNIEGDDTKKYGTPFDCGLAAPLQPSVCREINQRK